MKLHEYQAKSLLQAAGVPVPAGVRLGSLEEWADLGSRLPPGPWVVKAQVQTGGRGKAGGILKASALPELESAVRALFGRRLVTAQTGPGGLVVRQLWIEQAQAVQRELYIACALDRAAGRPVLMASAEGGMDIEELARTRPAAILREPVDPWTGLQPYQGRSLAQRLGVQGPALAAVAAAAQGLVQALLRADALLVEVNPLGLTAEGAAIAMDAKITLDDNARFRHPEAAAWMDPAEENPLDRRAAQAGVNYIGLTGSIGCLVNGAGLAMATMDLIKHHGGEPANFLDVGGGATQPQVTEAFRILLADARVKGILVNIFGGIMKCDVIAQGIVAAAREVGLPVPLVVRLEGTNVEQGRAILQASGLKLQTAQDLTEAAEKIVAATRS